MSEKIGVIDYGGGNLRNVLNTLKHIGREGILVASGGDLDQVDRLIFPGVGAFGDCVSHLDERGLREPVIEWLRNDRPFFGICLGYQVLFEGSEESPESRGLGFFPGKVVRFSGGNGLKIPHMGWNEVNPSHRDGSIWKDVPDPLYLYFVHSFYPRPDDEDLISSRTDYGGDFASSVARGNMFACQFHPERSQESGIQILRNFLQVEA